MKNEMIRHYFILFLLITFGQSSPLWGLSLNKDGPTPMGPPIGNIDSRCRASSDCVITSYAFSNRNCTLPEVTAPTLCLGIQKAILGLDCQLFSNEVALHCQDTKDAMVSKRCTNGQEACVALTEALKNKSCDDITFSSPRELCKGIRGAGIRRPEDLVERSAIFKEMSDKRKGSCKPFDHREKFGPTRNQYMHGQCWSFAAAGLLEEQICLNNPADPLCGKSISTIDLSRELWSFGQEREGSISQLALLTAILRGVCPEELSPYPTSLDEENAYGEIKDLFEYIKYGKIKVVVCDPGPALPPAVNRFGEIFHLAREVSSIFRNYSQQDHIEKLPASFHLLLEDLHRFDPRWEFALRDALIPKICEDKRVLGPFKNLTPHSEDLYMQELAEKRPLVERVFAGGRSAILNLCSLKYLRHNEEKCGYHALVANGQRWGPKGFCEWNIKNSYGENSDFHGWLEADGILKETDTLIYLKKKAP